MWMVRAGENAFLINDFKDLGIVAIGWSMGDLTDTNLNEIKRKVKEFWGGSNKSVAMQAGQINRFVNKFKIGDYVLSYNPVNRNYLVGKITSDYYFSDKLSKLHENINFDNIRDVEWFGEVNRDNLNQQTAKPLQSATTIFKIHEKVKYELIKEFNRNHPVKIDFFNWKNFYIELADKLGNYKNNRKGLIEKVLKVYNDVGMELPKMEYDEYRKSIIPYDFAPFSVFGLFNSGISLEKRLKLVNQIKIEFSLESNAPSDFYGVPLIGVMYSTFYGFGSDREEGDIDNLWNLFESAIQFSGNPNSTNRENFIKYFNRVISQYAVSWNITQALFWIRPDTFISLDKFNKNLLSQDEIFSEEFGQEIKSLKTPPDGEEYLKICEYCTSIFENNEKYVDAIDFTYNAFIYEDEHIDPSNDGMGDEDVSTIKYWLISPGQGASLWNEFYENGDMGIGFDGTGDLRQYGSKEELKLKFQEMHDDNSSHMNNVHACWQFVHDIQIGDVVFAKKGMSEIIGRGIVEGDYEYDTNKPYHKIRKVKWTHKGNWKSEDKLPMKTLTDITNYQEFVDKIKNLFVTEDNQNETPEVQYPEYNSDKFLEEVYINEEDYNILVDLVNNKKNIIIEGAPGVGKTFMAKRLAYSIMGVKDVSRVMMVQFHQSYSYEDFVMGYRPYENGFRLKHGSFYKFCKKAEEDSENDYFFIIDEINRGNISKIFGELFMLIEADKRGEKNKIQLLYSDELFYIPENVHIIGLMNTADRSLAMIDYALRRRFAFFDLQPGFGSEGFKKYQEGLDDETFDNLIGSMQELNEEIGNDESLGEGFRIGHSYLCNIKENDVGDKLTYIVEYELIPLLKEYWFDEADKVDYWADKLRSVIDDS